MLFIHNERPILKNKFCVVDIFSCLLYNCISLKQRLVCLAEGNDDAQAPVIMRVEKALVNVVLYMEGRCTVVHLVCIL